VYGFVIIIAYKCNWFKFYCQETMRRKVTSAIISLVDDDDDKWFKGVI